MPTPFQHLDYAERIRHHPALSSSLRERLNGDFGAFLLGNTAADVQVITSQRRVQTHFYQLADLGRRSAVATLLDKHPELAAPRDLSPDRAAFVSGYLAHLAWDEVWAQELFLPYYRNAQGWPDPLAYSTHHNALRIFLDRKAYAGLQDRLKLPVLLRSLIFARWLPFAPDWALSRWRDWLVVQLEDPTAVQTVEVFAERMQIPMDRLERIVSSIARGSYTAVPGLDAAVAQYEERALSASLRTLVHYWGCA